MLNLATHTSAHDIHGKRPPCFVRVLGVRAERFVEFEFSIGEPELAIEMVMLFAAYEEFCARHNTTTLSDQTASALDDERRKWRYGAPGIRWK